MRDPIYTIVKMNKASQALKLTRMQQGFELRDEFGKCMNLLHKLDPTGYDYYSFLHQYSPDSSIIDGYTIKFYDESLLAAFRIIYE